MRNKNTKTVINVLYVKNGVTYKAVIPNMPDGSVEMAMIAKGIGRSQIASWRRVSVVSA